MACGGQHLSKLLQMVRDGDQDAALAVITGFGTKAAEICTTEVARDGTCLHLAARAGRTRLVQHMLDLKIDVNTRLECGNVVHGQTPLHAATKGGQLEVVKLLLKHGADVNALEADGFTPLHTACAHSKLDIVQHLLLYSSDVNIPNSAGQYPLHTSILRGPKEVPELLLEKGASVHVADHYAQTVLHYAAEWHDADLVNLFISNGAEINAQDSEGRAPLHVASDDDGVFGLLVEYGADQTRRDKRGRLPRDGVIDVSKEQFQNINKALGRHAHNAVENNPRRLSLEKSPTRVFSPGPPIPETELHQARRNMLQELRSKTKHGDAGQTPARQEMLEELTRKSKQH